MCYQYASYFCQKIKLLILLNSSDSQGSRLSAVLQSVTSEEQSSVADTTQDSVAVTYSRLADLSLSETSPTIPGDTNNLDLGQCLFKQNMISKAKGSWIWFACRYFRWKNMHHFLKNTGTCYSLKLPQKASLIFKTDQVVTYIILYIYYRGT